VLELVVFSMTCGAAVAVAGYEVVRRLGAPRALDAWAKSRGHRFAPAAPKRGIPSPRAFGSSDDAFFTIDFCRVRGEPRTRVCADVPRGRVPRIAVVQRSRFDRTFGSRPEIIGLPELDDSYIVHGATGDDARALLEPYLSAFVSLDRRADVRLFADGGRVTLMWAGVETDPHVLDAALSLTLATAAWQRPDAPYR
jgi:hypothetical protein